MAQISNKPIRESLRVTGECVMTKLADGRVFVDRADPRITISADLLDELRAGNCAPGVSIDGDLLYVEGVNRKAIYRIGEQIPDKFAYYAEWPD